MTSQSKSKATQEDQPFTPGELRAAFEVRNTQTLRVTALNSCGGLPYPDVRPQTLANRIRQLFCDHTW